MCGYFRQGYGADFAERPRAGGRLIGQKGSDPAPNRCVTFSVIQEIKIQGKIEFGANSDSLSASSMPLIQEVHKIMMELPHLSIRIEGHTCSAPSWGVSNEELSRGRSASVLSKLVGLGVQETRLQNKGWGDGRPAAPNTTSEGKKRNRL